MQVKYSISKNKQGSAINIEHEGLRILELKLAG